MRKRPHWKTHRYLAEVSECTVAARDGLKLTIVLKERKPAADQSSPAPLNVHVCSSLTGTWVAKKRQLLQLFPNCSQEIQSDINYYFYDLTGLIFAVRAAWTCPHAHAVLQFVFFSGRQFSLCLQQRILRMKVLKSNMSCCSDATGAKLHNL